MEDLTKMDLGIMFLIGVAFAWIIAPALVHMFIALYHLFTGVSDNERMDSKR